MSEPLYNWLKERGAGVLVHPTSLPSDIGIGGLGMEAYRMVDFLHEAGMKYWQMCPLGPTGFGDSPYQCFSAFAGNPYLIDLDDLIPSGVLQQNDLVELRKLPLDKVDYGGIYQKKWPVLRLAYKRFKKRRLKQLKKYGKFEAFKKEQQSWLKPYALFMALKDNFNGVPWQQWDVKFKSFKTASKIKLNDKITELFEMHQFYQFLFFGQWNQLKSYAAKKDIKIIGDIPIFVALDSADVWAFPENFQLQSNGQPTAVAGVPPDYFSPTGQLWGNPLFDWKTLEENKYNWWMKRLEINFSLFDIVRLDHFRGFESYWRVPAKAKDARSGKWTKGPGIKFFKAIKSKFPSAKIIAEDLGVITPAVRKLLSESGLPGMAISQFAFEGDAKNLYLPHNLNPNSIIYPGTHDNDTTKGWYENAPDEFKDQLRRYLRVSGDDVTWDIIRLVYRSVSKLAIIPMQDLLNLGSEARLNFPGSSLGNWQWRYTRNQFKNLKESSTEYLAEIAELYGR